MTTDWQKLLDLHSVFSKEYCTAENAAFLSLVEGGLVPCHILATIFGHKWKNQAGPLSLTSLEFHSSPVIPAAPLPPIFSAVLFELCAWLSNKTAESPEMKFPSGNLWGLQNFSHGCFHWWKPWWWLWYSGAFRPPRSSELLCKSHCLNTQWEGEWLRWVTSKSFTALLTRKGHSTSRYCNALKSFKQGVRSVWGL